MTDQPITVTQADREAIVEHRARKICERRGVNPDAETDPVGPVLEWHSEAYHINEAIEAMLPDSTTPAPSLEYARGFEAGQHDLKAMTAEEDAYHAPRQHSELADRLRVALSRWQSDGDDTWFSAEVGDAIAALRQTSVARSVNKLPEEAAFSPQGVASGFEAGDDIVERLLTTWPRIEAGPVTTAQRELIHEAAAEITRLRANTSKAAQIVEAWGQDRPELGNHPAILAAQIRALEEQL